MQNISKIILDGKKRKIFFNGSCLEIVKLCEAMCCREWDINLSYDELNSSLYKAEIFCTLTRNNCENQKISCMNREYRLKRKKDGSCIYLSSENKCHIYKKRPKVCKDFSCKGGWILSSVAPYAKKNNLKEATSELVADKIVSQKLKFDMCFIINPLIDLKSVFYLKEKNELVFRERIINRCNLYSFSSKFHNPTMNDDSLFYLIKLFNGQNILGNIYQSVKKKYNLDLSKEDFLKIVELLFLRQIIIFKCAK